MKKTNAHEGGQGTALPENAFQIAANRKSLVTPRDNVSATNNLRRVRKVAMKHAPSGGLMEPTAGAIFMPKVQGREVAAIDKARNNAIRRGTTR